MRGRRKAFPGQYGLQISGTEIDNSPCRVGRRMLFEAKGSQRRIIVVCWDEANYDRTRFRKATAIVREHTQFSGPLRLDDLGPR